MSEAPQQSQPPADLAAAIAALKANPADVVAAAKLGGLLHDHGMHAQADKIREHIVYMLQQGIAAGVDPNVVCNVLLLLYSDLVKKVETEAHTRASFQSWLEPVAAYGRRFQDPALPQALWAPTPARPWRAAFFLQTATVLGHTEAMLELLAHRPRGAPWHDEPVVFTLNGSLGKLDAMVAELGCRIVNLQDPDGPSLGHVEKFREIRRLVAEHGISHFVWISAPCMADFALAMRLAPAQVFWTLKFHPFRLPEIDGYITYGAWSEQTRVVHGEEWQVVPFMMSKPAPPVPPEHVAEARAPFARHDVLFGTLARTEKMNSPTFLDAVVRILRDNPQAGFLWTGRELHPGIQAHLAQGGVAERCHFIGWVQTPVYARVLDVFLESFPFGCGLTGIQALEAGTAFLSFDAPETQYGMHFQRPLAEAGAAAAEIRGLLAPADGGAPLLYARDADEYVALANRLARDPAFRRGVGAAGQAYYRRYLTDADRMAGRFFEVLAAVKTPEEVLS